MRALRLATVMTTVLLMPVASPAQTSGSATAAEKDKDKKKPQAKVFTLEDLRQAGRSEAQREADEAAAEKRAGGQEASGSAKEAGSAGAPKKSEDEERADQAKAWRERLEKAQENVNRLTAQVETLQQNLNDLTQNIYGSARAAQLNQLEEAKKQLAAAQQAVDDLQEEGQRAGY